MTTWVERTVPKAPAPAAHAQDLTTVVVVSYETREHVLACLTALRASTRTRLQVVVVDNASKDGSADAIAREHPWVELVRLDRNVGFAAGCNVGAGRARGRELLFLNPDARVRPGAVDRVVAFARASARPVVCGGRTLRSDGTLNPSSCWARPTLWSVLSQALGLTALFRGRRIFDPETLPGWARDTRRTVDVVSGCFLLVPRGVWERLGGFDERFFVYGEDADLCLRAESLGVERWIVPEAEVVHDGAASEPVRADKLVRLLRAKAQLLHKHWPPGRARFGVRMLDLWALTRIAGHALLAPLRRPSRDGLRTWRSVWRRRSAWRDADRPSGTPRDARAKVLAVASGGGHWVQLLRLAPAFEGHDVVYATVSRAYAADVPGARLRVVRDASRWSPLGLVAQASQVLLLCLRERPDVVITTGAAPGYFALRFGRLVGARTIWLDSLANADELSLSGKKAGACADLWLTQWPHLARPGGPRFEGSVL